MIMIILRGYIYSCLPPYNSNFRYFQINSLVTRTSSLRDSTVFQKYALLAINQYVQWSKIP